MDYNAYAEANELLECTFSDIRRELLETYPSITKYLSVFHVDLKHFPKTPRNRRFKDSVFVFKKKRLLLQAFQDHTDIYATDLREVELDTLNENKSRSSCERCRRFKKKCTRDLPECLNCSISEELCAYKPRKKRAFSNPKVVYDLDPVTAAQVPPPGPDSSYYIQSNKLTAADDTAYPRDTYFEGAMRTGEQQLREAALQRTQIRASSDLMRLLN